MGEDIELNRWRERTFKVITFGCPVNQGESAAIESAMRDEGFVKSEGRADINIINSCAVTGSAAAEARRVARKVKRENPGALVVLAGCYPQVYHAQLAGELPQVDIMIGTRGRSVLPALISERLIAGKDGTLMSVKEHGAGDSFEEMGTPAVQHRTRPVLKIQEGCNEFCTYCIVRQARGNSRSLPEDRVLQQARFLLEAGYKEVVLVGNQLGLYGRDLDGTDLPGIIHAVSRLPYEFRIRLGYVEPVSVTQDLLETVAVNPKVCKYLYLPVQSCSDRVLGKMGRRYRAADFAAMVKSARELMPDVSIWTDLIAGFPGEEDADHAATITMVRELALSRLHVFPYSPRPGTPAARMKDDVPPDIKKRRATELQELGGELAFAYHRAQVGRELQVLVERVVDANGRRYAEGYAGNYVQVRVAVDDTAAEAACAADGFATALVETAYPRLVKAK